MFETIQKIIADQMGIANLDKITPETILDEDLGADSLDAVEIIMAIEDFYAIEIPDEVAENIRTVSQILAFLEEELGEDQ